MPRFPLRGRRPGRTGFYRSVVVAGGTAPTINQYEFNAEPGTFAVTGVAATVPYGRVFDAQPGSFALAGIAATTALGRTLNAEPASFRIEGGRSFGETNVGDTWGNEGNGFKAGNKFTLAEAMVVHTMTAYLRSTAGGTQVRKAVIYSDSAGSPNALLGTSNEITVAATNTGAWVEATFATPVVLPAGDYWLGWHTGPTAGASDSRYATESNALRFNTDTYADGPSDPFGSPTTGNQRRSIYASSSPQLTMAAHRVLSADPGSFAVTGTAATVAAGKTFAADPAAYALTGVAATTLHGFAVIAEPGAYAITGAAADLVHTTVGAYNLNAEPGAFAVTGSDAGLQYLQHRTLDAQPGTFNVAGAAATTARGLFLSAVAGAYTVTGLAATVVSGRALLADPGAYTVTGNAATTAIGRVLNAQPAAYTLTGFDAGLNLATPGAYTINAEPGTYAVTGANATTITTRLINAQPTSYAITGVAATLFGEHNINAASGSFTITGFAATTTATRMLVASPGTYTFTGFAASVGTIFDMEIDAQPGAYVISGNATLVWVPGQIRNTTRGGRLRWNTTGGFRDVGNRAGRIAQNREGAVT